MAEGVRPGVVLALETSSSVGSVAVGRRGDVAARVFLEERGAHAARVVPAVDRVLREAGLDRRELDGVVVGAGPGSFTGVRVAAATAKGLTHALGLPLWARSSLASAALGDHVLGWHEGPWAAFPDVEPPLPSEIAGAPRYVLFDARASRVYAACYRFSGGRLEELVEPTATELDDVLGGAVPDGAWFAGSGALRHRERVRAAGLEVLPPPAGMPTAAGLLRVLELDPGGPVEDRAAWEPEYLRASGAERERAG